jgi:muconolactone D-isomerase
VRFLVHVAVDFPDELRAPDNPRRHELLAAELERGLELRRNGTIEAIWRVPGGLRNVGIWRVEGPTELDEVISSLPLASWLRVEVTALADHPIEQALGRGGD